MCDLRGRSLGPIFKADLRKSLLGSLLPLKDANGIDVGQLASTVVFVADAVMANVCEGDFELISIDLEPDGGLLLIALKFSIDIDPLLCLPINLTFALVFGTASFDLELINVLLVALLVSLCVALSLLDNSVDANDSDLLDGATLTVAIALVTGVAVKDVTVMVAVVADDDGFVVTVVVEVVVIVAVPDVVTETADLAL